MSSKDAKLYLRFKQCIEVALTLMSTMDVLEDRMREDMVHVLGKEISSSDFRSYLEFRHGNMLSPFCFSVRRPGMHPEGLISIVRNANDGELLKTVSKQFSTPARFSLNMTPFKCHVSASCTFHHSPQCLFTDKEKLDFSIQAKANPFSSFMLILGRIESGSFEPRHAIILRSEDHLDIPLSLGFIPSLSEFKKQVISMSKEQTEFSNSIRAMQMSGRGKRKRQLFL